MCFYLCICICIICLDRYLEKFNQMMHRSTYAGLGYGRVSLMTCIHASHMHHADMDKWKHSFNQLQTPPGIKLCTENVSTLCSGCPLVSILGPYLFTFFFNDFIYILFLKHISTVTYGDDETIGSW